jgi:arylsulfatase
MPMAMDGQQVTQGRIERTVRIRFSLDETFDVGEDTGTPVIEEYAARLPYKFTGTLAQLTIDLGAQTLSATDQKEIDEGAKAIKAAE